MSAGTGADTDSGPRLVVRLRGHREAAGLTQGELAALAGVSRKTVNTVENGVFVPSTELSLRLGRILGAPVEALFALPDDPRSADD